MLESCDKALHWDSPLTPDAALDTAIDNQNTRVSPTPWKLWLLRPPKVSTWKNSYNRPYLPGTHFWSSPTNSLSWLLSWYLHYKITRTCKRALPGNWQSMRDYTKSWLTYRERLPTWDNEFHWLPTILGHIWHPAWHRTMKSSAGLSQPIDQARNLL